MKVFLCDGIQGGEYVFTCREIDYIAGPTDAELKGAIAFASDAELGQQITLDYVQAERKGRTPIIKCGLLCGFTHPRHQLN